MSYVQRVFDVFRSVSNNFLIFVMDLNSKKLKRLESKRRKMKCLLDLVKSNEKERAKKLKLENCSVTTEALNDCVGAVVSDPVDFHKVCASIDNSTNISFSDKAPTGTLSDSLVNEEFSLVELRAQLKERRRLNEQNPLFYLTKEGLECQMELNKNNETYCVTRSNNKLLVQDIQLLLLHAIFGRTSSYNTRWCKLLRNQKISHVLFLAIDEMSAQFFSSNIHLFPNICSIFSNIVEVLPSASYGRSFYEEMMHVPLSFRAVKKSEINYPVSENSNFQTYSPLTSVFPMSNSSQLPDKVNLRNTDELYAGDTFPRTELLLSPIQMLMENFPFPTDVYPNGKCHGYVFTRDCYSQATNHSPLFALDCEMCLTTNRKLEVTRVSVVNEELQVVYDKLVKPEAEIINYLTKYSGITKIMLDPVTTNLTDVHNDLKCLLPSDAILCGQSLNCDLHALRIIHPYIIDTSVIYNISGRRTKKTSLKIYSHIFLNEQIQCDEDGHNSIEDCTATMKLVKLKLKNYPEFGDVILNDHISFLDSDGDKLADHGMSFDKSTGTPLNDDIHDLKNGSIDRAEPFHFSGLFCSLFMQLIQKNNTVCMIGTENILKQYPHNGVPPEVMKFVEKNNNDVVRTTVKEAPCYKVVFSHLNMLSEYEETPSKLDADIFNMYNSCADRALFVIACTGQKKENENTENALCMVVVKPPVNKV